MNATTSSTTTPTSSSPSPSHYHILRRLLSLCYNASPQTSYFYAGILFDLYNDELLNGIELPVAVAIDRAARDFEDLHSEHHNQRVKPRSGRATTTKPNRSSKGSSYPSSSQAHIERIQIPPHLALHLKAWSYLNAQEPYSAIHLVKEHIRSSDSALDRRFHWNNDQGTLDPIPSSLLESDTEAEDGSDGSSSDDDDKEEDDHLPSTTSSTLPKPRKSRTPRQKKKNLNLPCLECAMIFAKGCEVTARFEKGRMVLERTIKTLQKCLDEEEYHKLMSTPPSPLPLNPITPRLQLARLLSTSNTHKLGSIRQQQDTLPALPREEDDKENQGVWGRPGGARAGSRRMRLEEGTSGRCLEDVLKVDGRGRADGEWCWEAWEEFCDLGERWTHPESPFSEPTGWMPIEPFPTHLLPLPASIHQTELSHLLNSFSATSLGSTASGGSHYAASNAGTRMTTITTTTASSSTMTNLARIPTSTSGQSISDVPSSPPTESSYTSGPSPSKGRNTDDARERDTPRRKMSPLPRESPLIKAAHAGYPVSPPRGGGSGGMFTPVAGGMGASGSGNGMGLFHGGAPERPGKGKGRGMIRAESPPGDISFPDLSFYGTGEVRPEAYLLPGVRAPHDTHGHLGRGGAKANHPLPSIASQLFPQAHAKEASTFGFGETPRTAPSYEPGMGKPPVAKRPRSRAGELRMDEGARNATGRNVSGNGGNHATVRRSARLQENHGAKSQPSSIKPLQTRSEKQPRATAGAPLAPHKPSNTTNFRPAPPSSPPTSNGGEPPSSPSRSRLGGAETTPAPPAPVHDVFGENQYIADCWLMCLIKRCAAAVYAMSRYDCKQAMNLIDTLPSKVQGGAWALGLFGRCFYESAEYEISRNAFIHLRTLEPCRLRDMEWYSTVLWHLDDRAELSRLSQDLMTLDRSSAQTWIATGNSFALQGEHDQAVRCFKRASQVDPGMAYTWTLTAYEALEMEEFDRAISYYQTAVRTDVRHYHAWFGLGRVYQKTGKLKMAEYHFRRALSINPSNVVLYCCVGTVMEKRGDLGGALEVFEKALEIDHENKMARFRKARCLMGLERYLDALPILQHLSKVSSTEPSVLFLLGKLYRILGDVRSSTMMLTHARDLNPRLGLVVGSSAGLGLDEGEEEGEEGGGGRRRGGVGGGAGGGGARLRGVMRDE